MANQKITEKIKNILSLSKIDEYSVVLPSELDRVSYIEVNKFLENSGGQWNKQFKKHLFRETTKELYQSIDSGVAQDQKQIWQAYFTPKELAVRLVEIAEVSGQSCLEPSCGEGALLDEIYAQGAFKIQGIELNPEFANQAASKGYDVVVSDFLTTPLNIIEQVDRVVMNPPFTKNQDCKHVEHAYKFLKPGGRLVAIMGNNQTRKPFIKLIEDKTYKIKELEKGAFKSSGTMVNTLILTLDKPEAAAILV